MPPAPAERPREAEKEEQDGAWVDAELLRDVLHGGALVHLDVQRAVGKGENYLSVLYRTRVEYHPPGSQELHVKNLIVKGLPPGEFMHTFIEEAGFFRRESAMYDDVLPRLYAFADERVGNKSFKRFSAYSHKTSRPDTLILEDMRPHGFVMAARRDRLDLAHSKLVVQNIARLHALSLAYDEANPNYISQFDDILFCEDRRERLEQFVPPQLKAILEESRHWEGFTEISNKLEALEPKAVEKLIEVCKPIPEGRKVLLHGDCWVNNFLFKYSETGEPIDLCFVDFQLSHEGSPGLDLNYVLFSSLQTDVRIRHTEDLLHEYCDEFERCAKDLGYAGPLITFDEISGEVARTLYFGFTSVLTTMAVVLGDPEDAPDLSSLTDAEVEKGATNVFDTIYKSKTFRDAIQVVFRYFDKHGVFD